MHLYVFSTVIWYFTGGCMQKANIRAPAVERMLQRIELMINDFRMRNSVASSQMKDNICVFEHKICEFCL